MEEDAYDDEELEAEVDASDRPAYFDDVHLASQLINLLPAGSTAGTTAGLTICLTALRRASPLIRSLAG